MIDKQRMRTQLYSFALFANLIRICTI